MCAVAAAAKFHSSLFPAAEDRGELTSSSILEINLSLKCQLSFFKAHSCTWKHSGRGFTQGRTLKGVWGGEAVAAPVQHPLFHHLWNQDGLGWAQEIAPECLVCLIRVISPAVSLKSALVLLAGKYLWEFHFLCVSVAASPTVEPRERICGCWEPRPWLRRSRTGFHFLKYIRSVLLYLTQFQSFIEFFVQFEKYFGIPFPFTSKMGKEVM